MRFPPICRADWSPSQQRAATDIVSGPRGQLRGPFLPLMYSPDLASAVQKLGEYLRFGTQFPNALIELAVLVTARHFQCANIWHSHRALALEAGLELGIIAALAIGQRPAAMSERQAAIFAFATELTHDTEVSDDTFERVVALWDRTAAIDLVGLCGYYALLAMVLNTAQVPLPDGAELFQP